MSPQPVDESAWELETGLPNDIDAYMVNCRFGIRDEYRAAITVPEGEAEDETAGMMFIFDMVDAEGNQVGQQGYSVGKGWNPSEDGLTIEHPTKKNVVNSTKYGMLQKRVVAELKVPMHEYGPPLDASSWEGLGFHWMLEAFTTFTGKETNVLLPTLFLGKKDDIAAPKPVEKVSADETTEALVALAKAATGPKAFQVKAMKVPGVVDNDELMAQVMEDGPEGFYAKHHGG